jgi:transcription termination factor Rho
MPDKSIASDTPKRRGRPPRRRAEAEPAEAAPPVAAATPVAAAPPPVQPPAPAAEPEVQAEPAEAPRAADPSNPLAVPPGKRVVIGITGEPGAGKSALAHALVQLGARCVEADAIGHEIIEQTNVKRELARRFGDAIMNAEGDIDRRKLAALAFESAEATQALNRIVHPELARRIRETVGRSGGFVVLDCALLHELGVQDLCTGTVYVYAPREARAERVQARGWDEGELARREAALGTADERRKKCSLAVNNQGNEDQLGLYAKVILAKQLGVDLASLKRAAGPSAPSAPSGQANGDDGNDRDRDEQPAQAQAAQQAQPQQQQFEQPAPQLQQPQQPQRPQHGQHGQHGQRQPFNRQQNPNQQPQQPAPQFQQPERPAERPPVTVDLSSYLVKKLPELQVEAEKLDVRDVKWLKKHELIAEILRRVAGGRQDEIAFDGYMELYKDQHGYVRSHISHYNATNTDTFVTLQQLRRYGLKSGMHVKGTARAPRGNEKCPQLLAITEVMGEPENKRSPYQDFEHLVPLHAFERLFMELPNDPTDISLRIFDLACPIGKGQRGLIVAQPKCGKTVYLQKIAHAITTNNPEVILMVLLVDERPEEVTDMERSVKGEVISSTFDQPASRHVQVAETTINKAKRLVERGKDVVILLDSITRLARAYNTESPGSGRVMSGGIESGALIKPKQFFGAARKIEDGGSLTILATALVDTGSLADTVIFEEFKGTGNMELVLDRRLADRRVFPAINIAGSGTRKDDLLIHNKDELVRVWALRKFLAERSPQDAVEFLRSKLKNYKTNVEFLLSIDPEKVSSW